ncbi:MAG: carbohydrate ABC transporter permease [Butyricicoccus sp.]
MNRSHLKFEKLLPYVLVLPLLLWIIVTVLIPVVNVVMESLRNTTYVGTAGKFVGLDNYISVLKDKNYWTAWGKSAIWLIGCTVLQTIIAFATALMLNGSGRVRTIARTWTVIPWIIPTIVVSIMWQWIFNSSYGILNNVLMSIGIISSPVNFFSGDMALGTLIVINVWHWFPFTTIIILAGLATIPDELYESAAVDGASKFNQFRFITLPGLSHITFALGVIGTLWCFNIFDIIYITTEGGPLNLTTTVPVYIYREAFKNFKIGRSSAASIITAAFLLIIALVLAKVSKPNDDD